MAYFPNASAGDAFQMRQCFRCRNFREREDGRGKGCPVWDFHFLVAYDQIGDDKGAKALRQMLSILIPEDGVHPGDCSMFEHDGRDHDTLPLFGETRG